jgi:hypothetical protein
MLYFKAVDEPSDMRRQQIQVQQPTSNKIEKLNLGNDPPMLGKHHKSDIPPSKPYLPSKCHLQQIDRVDRETTSTERVRLNDPKVQPSPIELPNADRIARQSVRNGVEVKIRQKYRNERKVESSTWEEVDYKTTYPGFHSTQSSQGRP